MMRLFLILEEKKTQNLVKEPIKPVKNFRIVTKKPYSLLVKKFEKVVVKMGRENTNIVDGA